MCERSLEQPVAGPFPLKQVQATDAEPAGVQPYDKGKVAGKEVHLPLDTRMGAISTAPGSRAATLPAGPAVDSSCKHSGCRSGKPGPQLGRGRPKEPTSTGDS